MSAAELRRMAEVFRMLPERDRAIFASVRFDELDYIEAGRVHDCSALDVEETIARVLVALSRAARGETG